MKPIEYFFGILLSERTKKQTEKVILTIAIFSFLVHLVLIFMVDAGWLKSPSELLDNPIAAIYTPFSFILIRISFSVDGALNTILIVIAISFGLLMLLIHNLFEKQMHKGET